MNSTSRDLLVCASLFALAPCLSADVIVLAADGTGDFTSPNSAAAAAVSGDTVLIQPGDYAGLIFSGKSLGFVAAIPGTVTMQGLLVDDLTSSQRVLISGVDLSVPSGGFSALDVRDCEGAVRIENGTFISSVGSYGALQLAKGFPGAYIENSRDVAFSGCTLVGGAGESGVTGTTSLWEACPAPVPDWYEGGAGLEVVNSSVSVHQSSLLGGSGGDALAFYCGYSGPGGPALRGVASDVFLGGCELIGGTGGFVDTCECGGDGGTTLVIDDTRVDVLDSTLAVGGPAVGSLAGAMGPSPTVIGGSIVAMLPGSATELVAPAALTAGQLLPVDANGAPGDLVFLTASVNTGNLQIPGWAGPLLLGLPSSVGVLALGPIGAGGQASASFGTPTLPLGVEGATVFLQGLAIGAGGESVLTGSNAVTLLTSGLLP